MSSCLCAASLPRRGRRATKLDRFFLRFGASSSIAARPCSGAQTVSVQPTSSLSRATMPTECLYYGSPSDTGKALSRRAVRERGRRAGAAPEALEGLGVEAGGGACAVGGRRRKEYERARGVLVGQHRRHGPVQPLHRHRLPPEVALVPATHPRRPANTFETLFPPGLVRYLAGFPSGRVPMCLRSGPWGRCWIAAQRRPRMLRPSFRSAVAREHLRLRCIGIRPWG
jgi:hypothetical protein